MRTVRETHLPLKCRRGKVRDIYEIDEDRLLIVTTDRLSCFDVILPDAIPGKGRVLNKISVFWFKYLRRFSNWKIHDHFLTADIWNLWIEGILRSGDIDENDLIGRSMIAQKMDAVIPIECVMRSVLTGSAWEEYKKMGTVCGEELPWKNLKEGDRLPQYIFTPATKAEIGHDQNISRAQMAKILACWEWPGRGKCGEEAGLALTKFLEQFSRTVFFLGRMYAGSRGIDIRDTKLEFGIKDDQVYLIDEVLTPDSSRFWHKEKNESYDKQFVRGWLEGSGWNKEPPAPRLQEGVIQETARRYQEIYRRLSG